MMFILITIIVVGLIQIKLANLANTKVKRERYLLFLSIFPHYMCHKGGGGNTYSLGTRTCNGIDVPDFSIQEQLSIFTFWV